MVSSSLSIETVRLLERQHAALQHGFGIIGVNRPRRARRREQSDAYQGSSGHRAGAVGGDCNGAATGGVGRQVMSKVSVARTELLVVPKRLPTRARPRSYTYATSNWSGRRLSVMPLPYDVSSMPARTATRVARDRLLDPEVRVEGRRRRSGETIAAIELGPPDVDDPARPRHGRSAQAKLVARAPARRSRPARLSGPPRRDSRSRGFPPGPGEPVARRRQTPRTDAIASRNERRRGPDCRRGVAALNCDSS